MCIIQSSTRGKSQSWQFSWIFFYGLWGKKDLIQKISLCTMSKITQGYYGSSCEYCTWFAHLLPRTVLALSSRKLWTLFGFLDFCISTSVKIGGVWVQHRDSGALGIGFCLIPWHWTGHKVKSKEVYHNRLHGAHCREYSYGLLLLDDCQSYSAHHSGPSLFIIYHHCQ